ncbi:uncharacterized protein EAE98_011996 [Botrytis deweyae]|uniref:Uncharacterized protein n=1 Tax=Botrytis deweyae TaxID=2478750 RepID=A0ABQ7I4B8_9HELO|nr:uncharacterized protein EAE98_011996 [Botrytis deweyae]KAF7910466.1 hypothetical protein EAE99_011240 [Botrytis elliptica]KAF7911526.1 hypothetical protein EAE98_011996 [Botrytis deweyae]
MDPLMATAPPNAPRTLREEDKLNVDEKKVFEELWKDENNHVAATMSTKMTEEAKTNDKMDKKPDCYSVSRMEKVIEAHRADLKKEADKKEKEKKEGEGKKEL